MKSKIKEINNKIEPYYLLILMLVFFIGGFITLYKLLFSPPDLTVKIEKENINYPASINNKYISLFNYVQDSTNDLDLKRKSTEVYQYLIKTKHQRSLEIINNTNRTIKTINIRMSNVRDLTSWAVSSSYLLEEEKDKLLKNILFQENSGIIYLKDAVDLPPNGSLKIYLWGEFIDHSWLETLSVDFDGGAAKIEYSKSFSGLKALFAEYFFEIIFFIIITFIIVYLLQIKKYVDIKETDSKSD